MHSAEFAILGAGAMGSIVGAHLARAGHTVVMLARPARGHDIEQQGLRIRGLSEFSQPVTVICDPAQFKGADVLIVATKTHATMAALEPLRHADIGSAFSMQNGLMKNDQLISILGRERVLGSLADASGELLPGGEVLFTRNGCLYLGELDGSAGERATRIATTIDKAGVHASAETDILSLEWSKFASWAGLMVLSVTTRANSWKYLVEPEASRVLVRLVREVIALADARGITLSNRSTLPVAHLAAGTEDEAIALLRELGERMRVNAPEHRMSTLQDLLAGRALEVEETLGYAVQQARAIALPVPLLDAFYHLISGIDRIQHRDR